MGANKATEEYFPLLVDDVQKSEALLRDSLEFMNSQYLMSKHYNNNTKQMDASYEVCNGLTVRICIVFFYHLYYYTITENCWWSVWKNGALV